MFMQRTTLAALAVALAAAGCANMTETQKGTATAAPMPARRSAR